MPTSRHDIETILTCEMSEADALAIAELLITVWPKKDVTPSDRAVVLRTDRGDSHVSKDVASRSLIIRDGTQVIAHAAVFPRTVGTTMGDLTIAALASVCTAPNYRGHHLGEAIVRRAWQAVDEGRIPFSLFQTSERVRRWYQQLGSTAVDNQIVNSNAEDPRSCPFKDDCIMRYPADRPGWPDGEIDLRGPGY